MFDGLSSSPGLSEKDLLTSGDILHFAPERQLRSRIASCARKYVTADFDRGDCDLKLDMSCMPSVQDDSFDVVIACDVLEHVPDDRAAIREVWRILRKGGRAILTVPQKDSPSHTDEDPSVTSAAEREKRFGQKDHFRIFGDDFVERLAEAGFSVTIVSACDFAAEDVTRHVLYPPAPNPHPLATNRRRIYLATKQAAA